jgi:hypothetical protein
MGCRKTDIGTNPVAVVTVSQFIGDTSTVFLFDAGGSWDKESESCYLKSRWDFNSDGVWDTDLSTNLETSYRFTQIGQYNVTVEIIDPSNLNDVDFIKVTIKEHLRDSVLVDQRDQKSYRIVKIENRWWMAEDLVVGNPINHPNNPSDNGIPEFYWTDGQVTPGMAYYSWNEVTNYGTDTITGICPSGWRMPNRQELERLERFGLYLPDMGIYFGQGGFYGLNIPLNGVYMSVTNQIRMYSQNSYYWIGGKKSDGSYDFWFHDDKYHLQVLNSLSQSRYITWMRTDYPSAEFSDFYLTVRCLKDD